MNIPEGYNEEEVIKIIMDILENIAETYTFDMYDKEDIKQEGFIIALKVLNDYKGITTLKNFMTLTLHRKLKTFKRDNYVRPDRACSNCSVFNKNCERCIKRRQNQTNKLNLLNPIDIHSNIKEERKISYKSSLLDTLEIIDLVDKINKELPVEFREDYLRLKEGLSVPKARRERIEQLITEIVENHD